MYRDWRLRNELQLVILKFVYVLQVVRDAIHIQPIVIGIVDIGSYGDRVTRGDDARIRNFNMLFLQVEDHVLDLSGVNR